jgi:SAM-dependent methyltransferase
MQERHKQRDRYFAEQSFTTGNFVIPFLREHFTPAEGSIVLEIGCGEGGNLKPFLDKGCTVTGIDILQGKIDNAKRFFADHPNKANLELLAMDIYEAGPEHSGKYDLIIMRDVLEHIHDHVRFMAFVSSLLKPGGLFFLGFPPWQNPFGGHQQMCHSKILSKLPYVHLLPGKMYPWLLRLANEPGGRIADLLEIRHTRITIEKFKKLVKTGDYEVLKEVFWFINPNYKIKFGLKPRKQSVVISTIPWVRNFFITTCYYILRRA